jgi:hypothetical protein
MLISLTQLNIVMTLVSALLQDGKGLAEGMTYMYIAVTMALYRHTIPLSLLLLTILPIL